MVTHSQLKSKIFQQLVQANQHVDLTELYWQVVMTVDLEKFDEFVQLCAKNSYPWSYVKDIIEKYFEWNQQFHWTNYMELVSLYPCEILSDSNELEKICLQVIAENAKAVEDYKKGKVAALNSLKGKIMKLTNGKADIKIVEELLKSKL